MPESSPTCQIHEKYRLIKCANPPIPWDPQGFCILHSESKEKGLPAFREALRARWEQPEAERLDFRGEGEDWRVRMSDTK